MAQRLGRGIALLFHDRGTRRGWVVSSTPRPHFATGKDPVPISQETGWAPGQVWTGVKSRPHRDSIPDRPARSQSLYRLSYPAHKFMIIPCLNLLRITNVSDKLVAKVISHNLCSRNFSRKSSSLWRRVENKVQTGRGRQCDMVQMSCSLQGGEIRQIIQQHS